MCTTTINTTITTTNREKAGENFFRSACDTEGKTANYEGIQIHYNFWQSRTDRQKVSFPQQRTGFSAKKNVSLRKIKQRKVSLIARFLVQGNKICWKEEVGALLVSNSSVTACDMLEKLILHSIRTLKKNFFLLATFRSRNVMKMYSYLWPPCSMLVFMKKKPFITQRYVEQSGNWYVFLREEICPQCTLHANCRARWRINVGYIVQRSRKVMEKE